MRRCRFREHMGTSIFKKGEVYFYDIKEMTSKYDLYKYRVYNKDGNKKLGEFSEDYFNLHFMDMVEERKLKIKNINNA